MKKLILLFTLCMLTSCNNTAVKKITDSFTPEPEIIEIEKVVSNGEPEGPHTSTEWKVWAYSTAAPSYIAANCTVLDVDGTVLREGTNGWTAMAANPRGMADPENGWKDPHEAMPMVGDGPAMKWAMAYMSGKTPEMDKDGWAWMLHGDMGEDNSKHLVFNKEDAAEGEWIESGAHLMLFPKDPASLEGQSTDFNSGAPYVMFKGTGYDHLMIPVQDYYKYQAPK
ncbi:MAG: hypothetical protein H8E55_08865 [Pelagibacterales bacterium]|jgi:hypothetical protein|nr:hypothetical protein [Pelagibacterales bacterium]MDG1830874.1 hypothetical protein [Flavobacteriaceae bacterium]